MKRILFLLTLLCSPLALAQIDVSVTARTAQAFQIGANLVWATTGSVGGFNNNFVVQGIAPDLGICVYVQNNDSISHQFTLAVSQVADPTVRTYTNNTAQWTGTSVYGNNLLGPGTLLLAATSTTALFAKTSGASRIALSFSGGSGAGSTPTANIWALQTSQVGCGNSPFVTNITSAGPSTTVQCDQVKHVNFAAGASSAPFISLTTGTLTYICELSATVTATQTTAGQITIVDGSTNSCTSPVTMWNFDTQTAQGTLYNIGSNLGYIAKAPLNAGVCVSNSGTGGSVTLHVSYAQIAPPIQ